MAINYVSGLDVFSSSESDQKPSIAIPELGQGSGDVNEGQGGDCVWLAPIYAPEKQYAASSLSLSIQANIDTDRHDIARGAGGKYRYLNAEKDGSTAIYNLALYRATTEQSSAPSGYSGMSTDLNRNRGGSYLYVIWKSSSIP